MAITENNYTGNGSTTVFPITFDYLVDSDVKVTLNGVATTAFTILITKEVQFVTAPGNLVAIRIYRETDDSELSATFFPGSSVRAEDLNDNFTQGLYIAQETSNKATTASNVANGIAAVANAALPKAGGIMTGTLVFAPGQPTATTSSPNIVQLSNSLTSNSDTTAATSSTVATLKTSVDAKNTITSFSTAVSGYSAVSWSIPSTAKRITVQLSSVSASSNSTSFLIRLNGETTGYSSNASGVGSNTFETGNISTSFLVPGVANAAAVFSGQVILTKLDGTNTWVASYVVQSTGTNQTIVGGGTKTLGTSIGILGVFCSTGTYDNGTIGVLIDS